MTNILFGTNYESLAGTIAAAASTGSASGLDVSNLTSGPRSQHWRSSNTFSYGGYAQILYTTASYAPNYLAIARADLAALRFATGIEPQIVYGAGATQQTWCDVLSSATLANFSACGENYVYNFAGAAPATVWGVQLWPQAGSTTPAPMELSKLYIGKAIDLGRDPTTIQFQNLRAHRTQPRNLAEIVLTYNDISSTATLDLKTRMLSIAEYQPLFVWTVANHGTLFYRRCIQCMVFDAQIPPTITNRNDVTLALREVM